MGEGTGAAAPPRERRLPSPLYTLTSPNSPIWPVFRCRRPPPAGLRALHSDPRPVAATADLARPPSAQWQRRRHGGQSLPAAARVALHWPRQQARRVVGTRVAARHRAAVEMRREAAAAGHCSGRLTKITEACTAHTLHTNCTLNTAPSPACMHTGARGAPPETSTQARAPTHSRRRLLSPTHER